jgi:hypothetical protein
MKEISSIKNQTLDMEEATSMTKITRNKSSTTMRRPLESSRK